MLSRLSSRTIYLHRTTTAISYSATSRTRSRNSIMSTTSAFVEKVLSLQPDLVGKTEEDKAKIAQVEVDGLVKDLDALNTKLNPLTFLNPSNTEPCIADVKLYCDLHPEMSTMPSSKYYTLPCVTRYFSHIQDLPSIASARSALPDSPFKTVEIDLENMPKLERKVEVKEKKAKKEGADASAPAGAKEGKKDKKAKGEAAQAGSETPTASGSKTSAEVAGATDSAVSAAEQTGESKKKQKKEKAEAAGGAGAEGGKKAGKAPKAAAAEPTGPLPSMIDLRVGKILNVAKHPDAESLYVETIDIGEETGPRIVCSGLVAYMSLEQIQDQTVVVVCNLKPVTMRGVKSFAMLLCATSAEGKDAGIEFVKPPAGSQPGERIYFEGEKYETVQPEALLNPKKKIFETIQPGFVTLDTLEAAWVDPETKSVHKIRTKEGACKVEKFAGASLS